jgi:spermidine/putrescine transport system ATP-binding protein
MAAAPVGAKALAACRPEAIGIGPDAPGENRVEAHIAQIAFAGASTMVAATPDMDPTLSLRARQPSRPDGAALSPGDAVTLAFPASACRLVLV